MSRNKRITVFVNDQEYRILRAVSPDDEAIGRTLRRLAMDRAEWLAEHGRKQRGRVPAAGAVAYEESPAAGVFELDTSYSQV
jgi:hypothetical protein